MTIYVKGGGMERGWRRRKEANTGRAFILISNGDDVMGFKVNIVRGGSEFINGSKTL
jgi:hypothetical protein